MPDRCTECGDVKPLGKHGRCAWRGGCEHRQFQHEARMHQLNEEMDRRERETGKWIAVETNLYFDQPRSQRRQRVNMPTPTTPPTICDNCGTPTTTAADPTEHGWKSYHMKDSFDPGDWHWTYVCPSCSAPPSSSYPSG